MVNGHFYSLEKDIVPQVLRLPHSPTTIRLHTLGLEVNIAQWRHRYKRDQYEILSTLDFPTPRGCIHVDVGVVTDRKDDDGSRGASLRLNLLKTLLQTAGVMLACQEYSSRD